MMSILIQCMVWARMGQKLIEFPVSGIACLDGNRLPWHFSRCQYDELYWREIGNPESHVLTACGVRGHVECFNRQLKLTFLSCKVYNRTFSFSE